MKPREWTVTVLEKIYRKELLAAERNRGKIPYTADEKGAFDDCSGDICWWTNGFYAGLLWQLYGYRKCTLFRECAVKIENKLDKNFTIARGMDHDSGFKWLLTAGADFAFTGKKASKNSSSPQTTLRGGSTPRAAFSARGTTTRAKTRGGRSSTV